MKDDPLWFFLEPYVHMVHTGGDLLLYNTVSKTVLEFNQIPALESIARELLNPANGYVIPLTGDRLATPEIQDFIIRVRQHFMGDLLDPGWSEGKPANIFPEPFVKYGLTPPPKKQTFTSAPDLDVRNYLQELTLVLNTGTSTTAGPLSYACLQMSFPSFLTDPVQEMDFTLFQAMMGDVNQYTPTLIHITGVNLASYPHLEQAIKLLGSSPFQKKYHLRMPHWDPALIPYILSLKQTTVALYITFPHPPDAVAKCLESIPDRRLRKKLEINFLISTKEELQTAMEVISSLELENTFLKPLLTGNNLDFFRENVFVTREDILLSQPDQRQVLARVSINDNDFGKFTVFPDGLVFANLNDPPVGQATKDSLVQLVEHELDHGLSWKRTRKDVAPCRSCIYQFLCPPISSYELFLNRFNFCHVYPEGKPL